MIANSKQLHIGVKIFFENPYVVCLEHTGFNFPNMNLSGFRKILKSTRNLIQGTWGYSNPEFETLALKESDLDANGLPTLASLFTSPEFRLRSYWVFKDEIDALQFRLSVGETARRVHMWPQDKTFTIYEAEETNES
jgi:hypothetical protein